MEVVRFDLAGVADLGAWRRRFGEFLVTVCGKWSAALVAVALSSPGVVVSIAGLNWFVQRETVIDHARALRWAKSRA